MINSPLSRPVFVSAGASNKVCRPGLVFLLVIPALLMWWPGHAWSMSAQEILDQVAKQAFADSFRVVLSVKTIKGKKPVSAHALWVMGKGGPGQMEFFVDFDEPKDSKGLRFLFLFKAPDGSRAFMHIPATGKTMPLAVDDAGVDLGGTGLSMEDIQGFIPRGGETPTLKTEEKCEGRDCYVLQIKLPDGKGERLVWVAKDSFIVVKTQHVDSKAKTGRTFRVTEFFKTDKGNEFPREEEITVPDKDVKIKVRQEHAVFGTELPEELFDPHKFGTFQWRN